jgi:DNA polymerase V
MADSDNVSVHSGFPNPANDQRTRRQALALDLNQLIVRRPSSTYLFRIAGHQWSDQGIDDGDVAVIDRALAARPVDLVLVWQTSGFAVMRRSRLTPPETVWGVVTATIHQYRPEAL